MPRAKYIAYDDESKLTIAVFEQGTNLAELKYMASQLLRPGIQSGISMTETDNPALWFGFISQLTDAEETAAIVRLKQIAKPQLPISILLATLTLRECRCRNHNDATIEFVFLPGMGPTDERQFLKRFYAEVTNIPLKKLLPEDRRAPIPPELYQAFRGLMVSLGAYMPVLEVVLRGKMCTKPNHS